MVVTTVVYLMSEKTGARHVVPPGDTHTHAQEMTNRHPVTGIQLIALTHTRTYTHRFTHMRSDLNIGFLKWDYVSER